MLRLMLVLMFVVMLVHLAQLNEKLVVGRLVLLVAVEELPDECCPQLLPAWQFKAISMLVAMLMPMLMPMPYAQWW